MKLLVVNWQDGANPQSGGAEIHLHEIFGRLAARGHSVALLVSGWGSAPARAEADGMTIFRTGSRYTFNTAAPACFRRELAARRFDLVVEDLNKAPLYTPRWAASPVVLLVHHLFGATAFREASPPVAAATWLLERTIPNFYRGLPVQAVSESTAEDLVRRGLRREDISVIHNGVDLEFLTPGDQPRFAVPTFAYVGRLRRYKRIDLILRAVAELKQRGTLVRLVIAGKGPFEGHLRAQADRLGIADRVEFRGFVSEDEKRELLRRAWANVYTSPKEGWGITNVEAAACGTPTVASDSPGLRESVLHQSTGLLVPHGDVPALASAMAALGASSELRQRLGEAALRWAQRFSWDRAAELTEKHLLGVAGEQLKTAAGSAGAAAT